MKTLFAILCSLVFVSFCATARADETKATTVPTSKTPAMKTVTGEELVTMLETVGYQVKSTAKNADGKITEIALKVNQNGWEVHMYIKIQNDHLILGAAVSTYESGAMAHQEVLQAMLLEAHNVFPASIYLYERKDNSGRLTLGMSQRIARTGVSVGSLNTNILDFIQKLERVLIARDRAEEKVKLKTAQKPEEAKAQVKP